MSRSLPTEPRRLRGPRRTSHPYQPRPSELVVLRRLARQHPPRTVDIAGPGARGAVVRLPRITESVPRGGHHHPARADDVEALLRRCGPWAFYGSKLISLVRCDAGSPAGRLVFGRWRSPGRIDLLEQPVPPWQPRGLLSPSDRARLERAGAIVDAIGETQRTVVHWPGDTLRDFMLFAKC